MKYKKIAISGIMLVHLMTQGVKLDATCVKGLPEGTKFVYGYFDTTYDHRFGLLWMVVEHDSFDIVKQGDLIPEFPKAEFN